MDTLLSLRAIGLPRDIYRNILEYTLLTPDEGMYLLRSFGSRVPSAIIVDYVLGEGMVLSIPHREMVNLWLPCSSCQFNLNPLICTLEYETGRSGFDILSFSEAARPLACAGIEIERDQEGTKISAWGDMMLEVTVTSGMEASVMRWFSRWFGSLLSLGVTNDAGRWRFDVPEDLGIESLHISSEDTMEIRVPAGLNKIRTSARNSFLDVPVQLVVGYRFYMMDDAARRIYPAETKMILYNGTTVNLVAV